jgi:hypothetical protein
MDVASVLQLDQGRIRNQSTPVVQTAVHALPLAPADISHSSRHGGNFRITGDQNSVWHVISTPNEW